MEQLDDAFISVVGELFGPDFKTQARTEGSRDELAPSQTRRFFRRGLQVGFLLSSYAEADSV